MRLRFDDQTEDFRSTFVAWLDANAPSPEAATDRPRSTSHLPDWARDWQRCLFDAGWLVPGNSPEFGGQNAGLLEQFVHQEELARRDIVPSFNPQGLGIIAPSILTFGTEEQKQQWATPLLRGDLTAALGMSEPNAGSDLAAMRTRAERDGESFVLNGQKVWTSGAHDADFVLTFVRTDPDARKHKGISAILVPCDLPGVERRPFGSIISKQDLDFNEVFFEDARVPAENLLGPQNEGWKVANGSLGHERAMLWITDSAHLDAFLMFFAKAVGETDLASDPRVLDWYASTAIDAQALKLLGYRTLAKTHRGTSAKEQSILKLFGSEAIQQALENAIETLGSDALDPTQLSAPFMHLQNDAYNVGWFDRYLRSFAGTIAGGTSEIQRNIVAERVLGLPR